jgi:hypothetical protein
MNSDTQNFDESPFQIKIPKYKKIDGSQFLGFLEDRLDSFRSQFLYSGAKELQLQQGIITPLPSHSLSLLTYAGLHPDLFTLGSQLETVHVDGGSQNSLAEFSKGIFCGNTVKIPSNSSMDATYPKNFEIWNARDEVNHLSIWIFAAMRILLGDQARSSLEVGLPLIGEDRPGRLDFVTAVDSDLIIFEAKRSIRAAVSDPRLLEQIPKYKREIEGVLGVGCYDGLESDVFLVLGGDERDLASVSFHPEFSAVGENLIAYCTEYNIKFVTANAIWQLVLLMITTNHSRFNVRRLLTVLSAEQDLVGLTSAGFIASDRTLINPLDY